MMRWFIAWLRWLVMWARLLFMWPTFRFFRLGHGIYCQVKRGTTEAQIAAVLAAAARNLQSRNRR